MVSYSHFLYIPSTILTSSCMLSLTSYDHTTAYVIGMTNFCHVLSILIGSWVIQWSGMITVGKGCDFKALPYLIVAFRVVLPLLIAIPAMCLIPNVLQTEHMIDWEMEGWLSADDNTNEPSSAGLSAREINISDGVGSINRHNCHRLVVANEDGGMDEDTEHEIT